MILFFDLTLLGVYYLVKPIYELFDINERDFSAKDHAFLIIWFIHSLNIYKVTGLFTNDSFYWKWITFSLMIILLLLGFYIYYEKRRMKEIINKKQNLSKKVLICIGTILYSFLTIYLSFFR